MKPLMPIPRSSEIGKEGKISADPIAKPLAALERHPEGNDPNELLKHRYLCRGGGLLLAGPTGVGKSSISMQMAISWALGRSAFDIEPVGPLSSLVIQSENDDGDLAEVRDGVLSGLKLNDTDRSAACEKIWVCRHDSTTGANFCETVLRRLLERHKPDLVWIDPVLGYLGGEASAQSDVSNFLRSGLNPLIREFECGIVLIHHTNKPPTNKNNRREWSGSEFAYLGSGSIEWANWPRAVLALQPKGEGVFELIAAKRGDRLHWEKQEGVRTNSVLIAHSKEPDCICWNMADPSLIQSKGRPKSRDEQEILHLLPSSGLTASEWEKRAKENLGISKSTFHRSRRQLEKQSKVERDAEGKWIPCGSGVTSSQ